MIASSINYKMLENEVEGVRECEIEREYICYRAAKLESRPCRALLCAFDQPCIIHVFIIELLVLWSLQACIAEKSCMVEESYGIHSSGHKLLPCMHSCARSTL